MSYQLVGKITHQFRVITALSGSLFSPDDDSLWFSRVFPLRLVYALLAIAVVVELDLLFFHLPVRNYALSIIYRTIL